MTNFCAILVDSVENNKNKFNNEELNNYKKDLNELVEQLNEKYKLDLVENFYIDEQNRIHGLLEHPYMFLDVVGFMYNNLTKYNLFVGIGVSKVFKTNGNYVVDKDSIKPIFALSESMLKKASTLKPAIRYKSNSLEDDLINSILFFLQTCSASKTDRQKEIVDAYNELKSQVDVAEMFDIKQPSVSNILKASMYREIKAAKESLVNFLKIKYL